MQDFCQSKVAFLPEFLDLPQMIDVFFLPFKSISKGHEKEMCLRDESFLMQDEIKELWSGTCSIGARKSGLCSDKVHF